MGSIFIFLIIRKLNYALFYMPFMLISLYHIKNTVREQLIWSSGKRYSRSTSDLFTDL